MELQKITHLLLVLSLLGNIVLSAQSTASPSVFRAGPNKNGFYLGTDFNTIKATKWQFKTGAAVRSSPTCIG